MRARDDANSFFLVTYTHESSMMISYQTTMRAYEDLYNNNHIIRILKNKDVTHYAT